MGVGSSSLPETTERGKEREEDEEGERRKERKMKKEREGKKEESCIGELAQLARALALQARGQGFDSLILHERRVKNRVP